MQVVYRDKNGNIYNNNELPTTKEVLNYLIENYHLYDTKDKILDLLDEYVFLGNDWLIIGEYMLKNVNSRFGKRLLKSYITSIIKEEKEYFGKRKVNLDDLFWDDTYEKLNSLGIFNYIFPNKKIKKRKRFCKVKK